MRVEALGDSAVTVQCGPGGVGAAEALAEEIRRAMGRGGGIAGVTEVMAAFESVTIYFDPARVPVSAESVVERIGACAESLAGEVGVGSEGPAGVVAKARGGGEVAEIPVRYGGETGPDLGVLAREKGMTEGELIRLHSSTTYTVLAMGFLPGFGYLGGVPEVLRAARLSRPRVRVPAGSVAIGGMYTGVYPFESPGGWNIIGHTSTRLFEASARTPSLLRVGQRVRFRVAG